MANPNDPRLVPGYQVVINYPGYRLHGMSTVIISVNASGLFVCEDPTLRGNRVLLLPRCLIPVNCPADKIEALKKIGKWTALKEAELTIEANNSADKYLKTPILSAKEFVDKYLDSEVMINHPSFPAAKGIVMGVYGANQVHVNVRPKVDYYMSPECLIPVNDTLRKKWEDMSLDEKKAAWADLTRDIPWKNPIIDHKNTPRTVTYCEKAPPPKVFKNAELVMNLSAKFEWERHAKESAVWREEYKFSAPREPDLFGGTTMPNGRFFDKNGVKTEEKCGYRCNLCGGWMRQVKIETKGE